MKPVFFFLLTISAIVAAIEIAGGEGYGRRTESAVRMTDLMRSDIAGVRGKEVIISRVDIPANTEIPKHYHPGEEFIYCIEGSAVLWQEGKPDTLLKAGDVFKVPLKQVHKARTRNEPAKIVVFRVHDKGRPIRVEVD